MRIQIESGRYCLLAGVILAACVEPIELPAAEVYVLDGGRGVDVHGYGYDGCPDPSAWSFVTWPEVNDVPISAVVVDPVDSGCRLELRPVAPLAARWYAVRSSAGEPTHRPALVLADGSAVIRFQGVPEAFVHQIVVEQLPDGAYIRTVFSAPVQPSPGLEWGDLMTATQGTASCTPPPGSMPLARLRCEGIDWTMPITLHVEGAVATYGGAVVPTFDTTVTIGPWTETGGVTIAPLPVPPPVPAALCGGVGCE